MHCISATILGNMFTMTGYYYVTTEQFNAIFEWYNIFDTEGETIELNDGMTLDPVKFEIKNLQPDETLINFINTYGNPFDILENIPELEHIFTNTVAAAEDDDDSILYTETSNISKLIHAHVTGDIKQVTNLLPKIKKTDSIVSAIRNKKEYKMKKTMAKK